MFNSETINFYETNYELINNWFVSPGEKVILGDKSNQTCRFCSQSKPEVSFNNIAHAIPEALGNKSIATHYECDECNSFFGQSIENDLGNWTKPNRVFARIRGKNGVPKIKKIGATNGWRIEYKEQSGLHISSYEDDPIFEINEEEKFVTFTVVRDAYTPVGVLKAFMKIGLTLIPENEIENFRLLLEWIKQKDYSVSFAETMPLIHTFVPGPMRSDVLAVSLLRRKNATQNLPYLFLVVGYGNDIFQVWLPSEVKDKGDGKTSEIPPFQPFSGMSSEFGKPQLSKIPLSSPNIVRGDKEKFTMGFDHLEIS